MAWPVQSRGFQAQRLRELGGFPSGATTGSTYPTEEYDDSTLSSDIAALQASVAALQSVDTELISDLADALTLISNNDYRLTSLMNVVEGFLYLLSEDTYSSGFDFGAFTSAVTTTKDLGDFSDPTTTFNDTFFVDKAYFVDCGSFA